MISALLLMGFQSFDSERIYSQFSKSVCSISASTGNEAKIGTGFVIRDRTILTAFHVVDGQAKITVVFSDQPKKEFVARLIKINRTTDLALIDVTTAKRAHLRYQGRTLNQDRRHLSFQARS